MKAEKLVRMANEIARNLRMLPDDKPVSGTAEHIRSFWTPGMRRTIVDYVNAGGTGLDPIAQQAVAQLREKPAA